MAHQRLCEYFSSTYQPGEKQLVRKIDFFILTFCCLSYFTNYVSILSKYPSTPLQSTSSRATDLPRLTQINPKNHSWIGPTSPTLTSRA